MSTKPRKFHSRKAHKKSHLGCKTCKRRRIKCDERLPSCSQCSRIDSPCPYLEMTPQELAFFREAKMKSDASSFMNMRTINPTTQTPMQGYGYPHPQVAPVPPPPPPPSQMMSHMIPMTYNPMPGSGGPGQAVPTQMRMPQMMPGSGPPPMPQQYYGYPSQTQMQVPQTQMPQLPATQMPPAHMGYAMPPQPQASQSLPQPPPPTQPPQQSPQSHAPAFTSLPPLHVRPNPEPSRAPSLPLPPQTQTTPHLAQVQTSPHLSQVLSPPQTRPPTQPVPQTQHLTQTQHLPPPPQITPPTHTQPHPSQLSHPPTLPPLSALTTTSNNDEEFSFQLPPIIQSHNPKHQTLPQKFGTSNTASIVKQGFETDMMRDAYGAWISESLRSADNHPVLYHSLLAFSHGYLYLKSQSKEAEINRTASTMLPQQFRDLSSYHRSKALSQIHTYTDNLGEKSSPQLPNASDALLVTTLVLSWDIFLQEDDLKPYIELSKGLAAVLQTLSLNTSQSPTTFCMAESLFQSIKSIHIPPYQSDFWYEFVEKYAGIRSEIMHPSLVLQYEEIEQFFANVTHLLRNEPRNYSKPTTYCPQILYRFLRRWLTVFPSRALCNFNSWQTREEKLLYSYCHAGSRALDALFPEVRFLFQIGFIGPVDLVGLDNSLEDTLGPTGHSQNPLTYPLRMVGFFKMRTSLASRILFDDDPFEGPDSLAERKKSRFAALREEFVSSFEHPILPQFDHYKANGCNEVESPESLSGSSVTGGMSPRTSVTTTTSTSGDEGSNPNPATVTSAVATSSWKQDAFLRYFADRMSILGSQAM